MNAISNKIGFWSALTLLSTFLIWIVCFAGIAATSPLFIWTDLNGYVDYIRTNNQFFQDLAKFAMFLFGPVYVMLVNSFHDQTSDTRKPLSRLGLLFGLAFATLSCIHYFIQLSVVKINLENGITDGMENFVQANPLSVMTSIDMLGWTLFLGLSSVFTAYSLKGVTLNEKWIKYALLMNGVSCLMAMVGYLLQINLVTFFFINIGVGGSIMAVSIASAILFFKNMK